MSTERFDVWWKSEGQFTRIDTPEPADGEFEKAVARAAWKAALASAAAPVAQAGDAGQWREGLSLLVEAWDRYWQNRLDGNAAKAFVLVIEESRRRLASTPPAAPTSDADTLIEKCAAVCDDVEEPRWYGYENPNTFQDGKWACAAAIRALKSGVRSQGKESGDAA